MISEGGGTELQATEVLQETLGFYSGGHRLIADVCRPPGATAEEPVAAVVLCHGYNGFRKLFLPAFAERLAAAGYATISLDYKGWGDSEGRAKRLAPYGRVEDVQAAVSYMEGCNWVDSRRLGVFGISFGGGTAVYAAAADSRIRVVISLGGVANGERWMRSVRAPWEMRALTTLARQHRKELARTGADVLVSRYEVLAFDPASKVIDTASRANTPYVVSELPLEFVWETLEFKPERLAPYVSPAALLLIAGEVDDLVPPEESAAMYEAAKEPKRLVYLPGIGHDEVYLPHGVALVMDEVLPWLQTYL